MSLLIGPFNRDDIVHIFESIEKNVNKKLNDGVMLKIINTAKKTSRERIERHGKHTIMNEIIQHISADIELRSESTDIHEILKKVIISKDVNFLGDDIKHELEPVSSEMKNAYIYLDTHHRSLINDDLSEFVWVFSRSYNEQGGINVYDTLRNITEMEIYPFQIPKGKFDAVIDLTGKNRLLELEQYNKITMRIREFDTQSIITQENWSFLFEFDIEEITIGNSDFYKLTPFANTRAIYKFALPVTELSTLTLLFGNPLHKILFDPDRITFATGSTSGGGASVITLNAVALGFSAVHNINVGDIVYFTEFSTVEGVPPSSDIVLIQFMNRIEGHVVTTVTPSTIEIEVFTVDTIVRPIPIPQPFSSVLIGSKRIMLKMRIGHYPTPFH